MKQNLYKKFLPFVLPFLLSSCSFVNFNFDNFLSSSGNDSGSNGSGHSHIFSEKVVSNDFKKADATCTMPAVYYYSCSCGESGTETFESGVPLGHDFSDFIYNDDATEEADGTKTRYCSRCDFVETVIAEGTRKGVFFDIVNGVIVGKGGYDGHYEEIIFVNNSVAEYALEGLNCDILVVTGEAKSLGKQAFAGCTFKDVYFLIDNLEIGEDLFAVTWDDPTFLIHASTNSQTWYSQTFDEFWENSILRGNKLIFEDSLPTFKKWKITFNTNGGNTIDSIERYLLKNLPVPEKEGYVFMGWYDNREFSGYPVSQNYQLIGNLTLFAKWLTIDQIPVSEGLEIENDEIIGRGNCKDVTLRLNKNVRFGAFSFDTSLINIIFDVGVTFLNGFAFERCENLKNVYFLDSNLKIDDVSVFGFLSDLNLWFSHSTFNDFYSTNPDFVNMYFAGEKIKLFDNLTIEYKFFDGETLIDLIVTKELVKNKTVPIKEGYVFFGWFLTPNFEGESYYDIFCFDHDVNLYCKWLDLRNVDGNQSKNLQIGIFNKQIMVTGIGQCTDENIVINMPIAPNAFAFVNSIKSVSFGENVTFIGDFAFAFCDNLVSAEFLTSVVPSTGNDLFCVTWDAFDFRVYCPKGCYSLFSNLDDVCWMGCVVNSGKLLERE